MLKKLFAVFASVLALAAVAFATESETVTVMGRGRGTNRTKALEDAYRNAIEQAVGLYANAEQLMENEELVKDQILIHSNAYIERYDIKKENDLGRGLTEVQILAVVKKAALTQKLKGLMPAQTFQLKGAKDIHAKTTTTQKRDKGAAAFVRNVLDGVNPITQMMTVTLAGSTPKAEEVKPDRGKAKTMYYLRVRASVDREKYFGTFLPSLLAVFDQVALEQPKNLHFNTIEEFQRKNGNSPSPDASAYGAQPLFHDHLIYINAVVLGNGDYKAGWNSGLRDCEIDRSPYKEDMAKQGCFHAVVVTEMNADRTVVKARHYRLPLECAPVLAKWYKNLAGNGQLTPYHAVIMDGEGREITSASFAFDSRTLLNCVLGAAMHTFGPPRRGGLGVNYGIYIAPLVSSFAESCERRVWFDIPARELPDVQSLKIELEE